MISALASLAGGEILGAKAFARAAGEYRAILSGHIAKENGALFPLADRVLPPAEQGRLTAAFDRIEAEEMGEGTHERYHAMIEGMAAKYLRTAGHVCR
jgi:hemerythrin-like domain-containing protein